MHQATLMLKLPNGAVVDPLFVAGITHLQAEEYAGKTIPERIMITTKNGHQNVCHTPHAKAYCEALAHSVDMARIEDWRRQTAEITRKKKKHRFISNP